MDSILFLINSVMLLLVCSHVACIWAAAWDPWDRRLLTCALIPPLMLLLLLGLGVMGLLLPGFITLVLLAALALVMIWRRKAPRWKFSFLDEDTTPGLQEDPKRLLFLLFAVAVLTVSLTIPLIRSAIKGPLFSNDHLSYHATYVAQWAIDGKIGLHSFNYQAYFPLNAEVLTMWFLVHLKSDSMAGLLGAFWLCLTAFGVVRLVVVLGSTAATGMLLAAAIIASPIIQTTAVWFSSTDLVGPSILLAALVLTLSRRKSHAPATVALPVGLLIGLAVGTKVTMAPLGVLIALWFVLGDKSGRVKSVILVLTGMLLTGGYWYARNLLVTGNPLFPAEVGPFQGPFTLQVQERTKLIYWIIADPVNSVQWSKIATSYLDWPGILGVAAVGGYVGGQFF